MLCCLPIARLPLSELAPRVMDQAHLVEGWSRASLCRSLVPRVGFDEAVVLFEEFRVGVHRGRDAHLGGFFEPRLVFGFGAVATEVERVQPGGLLVGARCHLREGDAVARIRLRFGERRPWIARRERRRPEERHG